MPTTTATVHMDASAPFTANIAGEVRLVILAAVRNDITVIAPNTKRSAIKRDLYAMEIVMKAAKAKPKKPAVLYGCRLYFSTTLHVVIVSYKQASSIPMSTGRF
jgi:hypothetical protein